jgi:FAD/FMN-containing dehydrogenase
MRWIHPTDAEYDEQRRLFNVMIDKRPAVIAACATPDDVVTALDRASRDGLALAVRAGGHSVAGYSTNDDGLVVDVRPMKDIEIDPVRRTARVGAGVTWGELDRAAQEHGLAVTGGRASTTGVAGFTLGGGSGWLDRKHGLACDNLTAVEMVTVDGRFVRADADQNTDLLWASRGGGGNFGVVTTLELDLHPVGPLIFGGLLGWTVDAAEDVGRTFRDWAQGAPNELGTGMIMLTAPPEPFIPEDLHGQPVVGLAVLWTGDEDTGQDVVATMRDLKPDLDLVGPMPYVEFNSMFDDPPGMRHYWSAEYHDDLSDDALEVFLRYGKDRPAPTVQQAVIPWGGAVAEATSRTTPMAQRSASWVTHPFASWADPADDEACISWVKDFRRDIAPYATGGVYLNFIGDEGQGRVAAAFGPENYARLRQIKAAHDPQNLLRGNQNIQPA